MPIVEGMPTVSPSAEVWAGASEGVKQTAKAEETVGRVERLSQEANAQLDAAAKARQEAERETTKLTKDAGTLLDAVRNQVDTLAMKKKEFEALDERLGALQSSVGDAEGRMEAVAVKDKHLTALTQKVDGLTKRFETLFAQSDELTKKQLSSSKPRWRRFSAR